MNQNYCNCQPGCCQPGCPDICSRPLCGDPNLLTVLTPVVYDEVGFNLCATIEVPEVGNTPTPFFSAYPTASRFSAEVVSMKLSTTPASVTITQVKPACYQVTLTCLTLNFVIHAYDNNNQCLASFTTTGEYLPTTGTEVTNPSCFVLQIYAPYGITYPSTLDFTTTTLNPTGCLNIISLMDESDMIHQGLNLITIPKVLSTNPANGELTMGVSFFLKSIYYAQYLIPHRGKVTVPKAEPTLSNNSVCLDFVNGNLVEHNAKPLELMPPQSEGSYKDCNCNPINIPNCPTCNIQPPPSTGPDSNPQPSPQPKQDSSDSSSTSNATTTTESQTQSPAFAFLNSSMNHNN
ncbi:hypothetical protein P261_00660 [Lachnospiraceae bacterium TWA4]|nr:hypothetical protein P261_00660 [Lachnospiraceae bacterium TWA4]